MITASPLVVMEHRVRSEESLAQVAVCYGVTAVQLHTLNHLAQPVTLQCGQELLVPVMLAYFQPQVVVRAVADLMPVPGGNDVGWSLPVGTVVTVQAQTVDSRWYWVVVGERIGWVRQTAVGPLLPNHF